MKRPALLLAAALFAALPAAATETLARVTAGSENISNGSPDWREYAAGLQWRFAPRQVLDLAAADVHRFGLHDSQFGASYSLPLSGSLTATVDANASDADRKAIMVRLNELLNRRSYIRNLVTNVQKELV